MNFTHEFWIQIAVYVLGGLVFVAINAYKLGQLEAKLATKDEVNRVYERFDEFKKCSNNDYVRKDMCGQLHLTSKDEMKRIDEEYKLFRHEIRNSVQRIYDEIGFLKESNFRTLSELKELILKK